MSINAYKHIIGNKLDLFESLTESEGTFSTGLHGTSEKMTNIIQIVLQNS